MDLSFIGDQLGNFATFADGIKKLFTGFAGVFDTIAGAAKQGDSYEFAPKTEQFNWMSSTK
ncbi:PorH family porin [Corynebacterium sp. UMB6689]|uniref:PorH family porin n=1 Tax=Corynebacterium sp. UMB6689 TaxID=3046341 RepID=UPI00254F6CD6|nr:PorH family porin [Corynebacterium sp. UMB6689]MDK6813300.1 PorH family porin [Corynebacterium sp. UMB6689]